MRMEEILLLAGDVTVLQDPERFREAYLAVSPERRAKTDRLRREEDQRLSLGAELLLFRGCREIGLEPEKLVIQTGTCGKPFFEGNPVHFNLSHSGSRVLCALSPVPVGCDTEKIQPADPGLISSAFFPEEQALLQRCSGEEERNRLFFRIWTLKESVLKCTGQGFHKRMDSFSVAECLEGKPLGSLWLGEKDLGDGYCYSFCAIAEGGRIGAAFRWEDL